LRPAGAGELRLGRGKVGLGSAARVGCAGLVPVIGTK
jgi:hypothetical protein